MRGKLWTSEYDFMENDGKSPFERYTFKQLLDLGIVMDYKSLNTFNDLYELFGVTMSMVDDKTGFMKNSDDILYSDHKLAKTPFGLIQEFEDCSLITGEKFLNGRDKNRFDEEGYDEFGFNELGFNKSGIHRVTGVKHDERGFYFEEKSQKWLNLVTGTQRDLLGYDVYGFDERGFERPTGPVEDEEGHYYYDVPLWHKRREDGTYDRNGSYTIRENCNEKGYDVHGFKSNGKSKFRVFEGRKANYKNAQGFWSNGAKTDKAPPFEKSDLYSRFGLDIDGYDENGFKEVKVNGKTIHVHRDTSAEYDRKGRTYVSTPKSITTILRQVPAISNTKIFMRQFIRHNKSFKEICEGYSKRVNMPVQEVEKNVKDMLAKAFEISRTAPEAFDRSDDFEGLEFYFVDKRGYSGKREKINEFFEICPSARIGLIHENEEIIRRLKILDVKKRLTTKEVKDKAELENKRAMYSKMRLDEK